MTIDIVSDLHLDTHRRPFDVIRALIPKSSDLIVAGDLSEIVRLDPAWLRAMLDKWENLYYVLGNHEYYGLSLRSDVTGLVPELPRLRVVQEAMVRVDNRDIAMATGWYPYSADLLASFRLIRDTTAIKDNAYAPTLNARHGMFFTTSKADVWVMHHLPFWASVAPEYRHDAANSYFVAAFEGDYLRSVKKPSVIVHGHTHARLDYEVYDGATRVVCNPYGYNHERQGRPYAVVTI